MKIQVSCKYCGYREVYFVYSEDGMIGKTCTKCGDKNLKIIEEESADVFGYNVEWKIFR